MNPQDKPGIRYLSQEQGFNAFPNIALSSYTFSMHVISALVYATIALNRAFLESFAASGNIMTAEKKAMASARAVFEDKFDEPEFLKSLARTVNDYSKWAKVSIWCAVQESIKHLFYME